MQKTPGAAAWMIVGWNDCGREEARRQRIALNCAGELRAEELRGPNCARRAPAASAGRRSQSRR